MEIRRAVQSGDVEQATEMVNELNPEILDRNPTLHFHLLQLHLIELIRHQRIPEALLFAQSELAPRGEENPQFLKELERTMALLAFEMPSLSSSTSTSTAPVVVASAAAGKKGKTIDEVPAMPESISSLLDQSQRLKTATELNAAILTAQSHGKDPKLPGLMKMLVWGETLLNDKGADFPKWDFHDLLKKETNGAGDAMVL
ncbi:CTLH/CRA C-terminal to lish motif domain-containing protein [Leucosporidium creatinivorum]|uniref:CTLH/CRA C-terminal to lish motif domain-containing protein n=1 Tax=Leucosporidium creatinivorum TaxID=106004 RepID=A0A1Y2G1P1_9BASI|nr:CTLH/CRA C-terminal to lish motif domain-containing protein [Leucosporidium creatinivorum]